MRIFAIAALAACLSGAAAYAEPENQSFHDACARAGRASAHVDGTEIRRILQRAMTEARAAIRESRLDEGTRAEIEAQVEAALEGARVEIAEAGDSVVLADLSDADQAAIEARVDAAMARAEAAIEAREAALERAQDAMERAQEAEERAGAVREDKTNALKLDGGVGYQGGARM